MVDFNDYDDNETEGSNVNITDSDDPTQKAGVVNGDLSTSDVINNVSDGIHTSVGTTAVRIDSPVLSNRKEVDILCHKDLYFGYSNSLTTANYAFFFRNGQAFGLALGPDVELWAISTTAGGTSDVVVTQGAKS